MASGERRGERTLVPCGGGGGGETVGRGGRHGKQQALGNSSAPRAQCTLYIPLQEQSYYIVHYIRRKEEGKEERKK